MENTLTIIMPAYNEETLIEISIRMAIEACKQLPFDYEILVINDGSTDRTCEIVEKLMKDYPKIRLINHVKNQGFGAAYNTGIRESKMTHCILLCADNTIGAESLWNVMSNIGKADLVLPYMANPHSRPWSRRSISWVYVNLLNVIFGYRLKYYNAFNIFPTQALKIMEITPSFAFSAQMVIRLLKSGYTYVEVPFENIGRTAGKTKAFCAKNVAQVIKALISLFIEVYFSNNLTKLEALRSSRL